MNGYKVDIIIPIYSSYKDFTKCINSVLDNTSKDMYNLILINDNDDIEIDNYLFKLEAKGIENIFIHNSEKKLGFIECINIGINYSQYNDVVLLNSDIIVTKNWLSKLRDSAYLNQYIATSVPLINDTPIFNDLQYDKYIKNYSLEKYSEIIENGSIKLYPHMNIAIGSCIYIRRNFIKDMACIDTKLYPRDYLEQRIFYIESKIKKYSNILCDNTFVYKMNSTDNTHYSQNYYDNNLQVKEDILNIKNNIDLQMKLKNNKLNVLFIAHNDILGRDGFIGGTEIHIKDLIYNIKEVNSFLLYIDNNYMCLNCYIDDNILSFKFKLDKNISILDFTNKQYKENLEQIINYFDISCIHVHHFFRHTFDAVDIAKQYNIPIYLTLHDYYLICPKVNLLDYNNKFCLENISLNKCNKCLKKSYGYHDGIIYLWNKNVYKKLKQFNRIFAPSQSVIDIFKKFYINMYGKFNINIEVIEHGVSRTYTNTIEKSDKFRVAFIGSIVPHKGSKLIYEVINDNKNKDIEWHIFGQISDEKLNLLESNQLIRHGKYEVNQIEELLIRDKINLVCILSICPETYSYTLSESICAKIPVLVTNLGALKDRVSQYNCGWILNKEVSSKNILETINNIIKNKDDYTQKISNLNKIKFLYKYEECNRYKDIYLSKNNKKTSLKYNLVRDSRNISDKFIKQILNIDYTIENSKNEIATVMMLSYNNLQYIKTAINSVLKQNYKKIELIINDDASKAFDNKFVASLINYIEKNKGPNLISYRIERNKTNMGIVRSYNKIIDLAKGHYLIPLCCDDAFYNENVVSAIVEYFKHSDKLIATGYRACYDNKLKNLNNIMPLKKDIDYLYKTTQELYEYLCIDNFIAGACTSYTKELIEKYGKFDEDYVLLEDWGRYLNLARRGCEIGFIDDTLIKYRDGGVTAQKNNNNTKAKKIILKDVAVLKNKEILPYQNGIQKISNLGNYAINKNYSNDINIKQIQNFQYINNVEINLNKIHFTSIIILTYNQLEYTQLCIESIRKFTPKNTYEIIVVDNGSTDGTVEWLKQQIDINSIINKENMGFSKGCNQGIRIAKGDNILLLNNDTIVTPNWLYNLDASLWRGENIGAVGCMSNYVTNNQQVQVDYTNIYFMLQYALKFNKLNFNNHHEMNKLIGFCMMMKKEAINKIGLLDENFLIGNFEDDDYCIRLRKAGYKLILCNDTFIHHFGSVSFKNTPGLDIFEISKINEEKFKNKWNL